MTKYKGKFNGYVAEVEAYWVPELERWVVPSEDKGVGYLWTDADFWDNFERVEDE